MKIVKNSSLSNFNRVNTIDINSPFLNDLKIIEKKEKCCLDENIKKDD
jgi:hypothetical protein